MSGEQDAELSDIMDSMSSSDLEDYEESTHSRRTSHASAATARASGGTGVGDTPGQASSVHKPLRAVVHTPTGTHRKRMSEMTDEERARVRECNRVTARKRRLKKKFEHQLLVQRIERLNDENSSLQDMASALTSRLERLKGHIVMQCASSPKFAEAIRRIVRPPPPPETPMLSSFSSLTSLSAVAAAQAPVVPQIAFPHVQNLGLIAALPRDAAIAPPQQVPTVDSSPALYHHGFTPVGSATQQRAIHSSSAQPIQLPLGGVDTVAQSGMQRPSASHPAPSITPVAAPWANPVPVGPEPLASSPAMSAAPLATQMAAPASASAPLATQAGGAVYQEYIPTSSSPHPDPFAANPFSPGIVGLSPLFSSILAPWNRSSGDSSPAQEVSRTRPGTTPPESALPVPTFQQPFAFIGGNTVLSTTTPASPIVMSSPLSQSLLTLIGQQQQPMSAIPPAPGITQQSTQGANTLTQAQLQQLAFAGVDQASHRADNIASALGGYPAPGYAHQQQQQALISSLTPSLTTQLPISGGLVASPWAQILSAARAATPPAQPIVAPHATAVPLGILMSQQPAQGSLQLANSFGSIQNIQGMQQADAKVPPAYAQPNPLTRAAGKTGSLLSFQPAPSPATNANLTSLYAAIGLDRGAPMNTSSGNTWSAYAPTPSTHPSPHPSLRQLFGPDTLQYDDGTLTKDMSFFPSSCLP